MLTIMNELLNDNLHGIAQGYARFLQENPTIAPSSAPTTTTATDEAVIVPWSVVWVTLLVSLCVGTFLYISYLTLRHMHYKQNNFDLYEMRQFGGLSHRMPEPYNYMKNENNFCCSFGWARAAIQTSEQETLRMVGMDAYMFLRFLKLCFRISLFGTVLGCLILIPIYATGEATGNDTEEFNSITLAKVESGSRRLWATAVCWLLFVCFALRELYLEWKLTYAPRRLEFLAHGDFNTDQEYRYACMIESIPTHLRTNRALYDYFNRLFPNSIHQVHVCMNTVKLDGLVKKRTQVLNKLEMYDALQQLHPDKPAPVIKQNTNKCGCGGTQTEAIPYFNGQLQELNAQIDEERAKLFSEAMGTGVSSNDTNAILGMFQGIGTNIGQGIQGIGTNVGKGFTGVFQNKKDSASSNEDSHAVVGVQSSSSNNNHNDKAQDPVETPVQQDTDENNNNNTATISDKMSSTAFVTFTSLKAKQAAIQCNIGGKANYLEVTPAPEPKAIVWNFVDVPVSEQRHTSMILAAVWSVGIAFWAVPATFVMGLANLNSLLQSLKLPTLNEDSFWYGLLAGLLPPLALQLFMVVLCLVINSCAAFVIRMKSSPQVDAYTFSWYQVYQFANLWFLLIVSTNG
jgi:hypothetical protein